MAASAGSPSRMKPSRGLIERLPADILIKILSYLHATDIFNTTHVNKLFYQLASNNAVWYKLYVTEFGDKQKRLPGHVNELLAKMATVDLKDCNAGYWKWLFLETQAECGKKRQWKTQLQHISRYTGLPSKTEGILRNLHVTWELTFSDISGHGGTLELNWSRFSETSLSLCWSGGEHLPNYQQISTLQLYSVRKIALSRHELQRSLMSKLDMQALIKSAKVIGQDRLVELKLLQPGIIIGTWKGQCSVAFIMFNLHFHKLVERSIKGSSSSPYKVQMIKPPSDDVDPNYGLHGYHLHIELHKTDGQLMSATFSKLFCHRTQIHDGLIQLTAIGDTKFFQYTPLSGNITLPWGCEVLQGSVENCCIMSLTLLDEFRKPFWCVTSPVSMTPENTSISYDDSGDHFLIHYLDSDGQVRITLSRMEEQECVLVTGLVVYVSVSKVNMHFSRDY